MGGAASDLEDGVKKGFRRQPACSRVGIILFVVLVPFVWTNRQLIGSGLADQLNQMTRVESAIDEFPRQVLEQRRIPWWIAGTDIVQRLDDSNAGKVPPE